MLACVPQKNHAAQIACSPRHAASCNLCAVCANLVSSTGFMFKKEGGEALAPYRLSMPSYEAVPDAPVLLQLASQHFLQLIVRLLQ